MRDPEQACCPRLVDRVDPGGRGQLGENVVKMALHGPLRDAEPVSDLAVAKGISGFGEDLNLPTRQAHAVVDFRDLEKASGHRKNNMAGLGGNLADGGVQLPG